MSTIMQRVRRILGGLSRDVWGRAAAAAGAFVVYPELLTFSRIPLSDDIFISDIFNGELPSRIYVGESLMRGDWPIWSRLAGNGFPVGVGWLGDPIAALVFGLAPRSASLSIFLAILLLVAGQGVYGLVRRLGGTPWGGIFASIAFSNSGYFIAQMRHTSVLATVAWLPWGVLALDRALVERGNEASLLSRSFAQLGWFAAIVGLQALAGFPQSLYICAIAYGTYAAGCLLQRLVRERSAKAALSRASVTLMAVVLGIAMGALSWMPVAQLAENSGRDADFATNFGKNICYRSIDAWNLLFPYSQGDISNLTFRGRCPFWEVYGYAGFATPLLAFAGVLAARKRVSIYLVALISVLAMIAVLGPATKLFPLIWNYVPGMNRFRFPTRFLVVVDFGLTVLAGIFISDLLGWLSARTAARWRQLTVPLGVMLIGSLAVDLHIHQRRQNKIVDAESFLEPPAVVRHLEGHVPKANVATPLVYLFHEQAFRAAGAWSDSEPYRKLRGTIQPNLGLLWNVPSVDLYAGIAPGHWATLWGDHVHPSLFGNLFGLTRGHVIVSSTYAKLARTFGVTHLLSQVPISSVGFGSPTVLSDGVYVYRLEGRRARWLQAAVVAPVPSAAARLMVQSDLDTTVVLATGEALQPTSLTAGFDPVVEDLSPTHLRVDVSKAHGGYLFLADTYYPGWVARVDGHETPVLRANLAGRAVRLPAGARSVDFVFEAPVMAAGATVSGAASTGLLLWAWIALRSRRQERASVRTG